MVNYNNSKIYKIVSSQTDKVYVGSTTKNRLSQRRAKHREDYRRYLNKKYHYITSFDIVKYDDAEIILIEAFPCETKDELHKRERYWIENTNNCVNKYVPTRTQKEYREKNKEKIKEYRNEKLLCVCGSQYARKHKSHHEKTEKHISFITKQ